MHEPILYLKNELKISISTPNPVATHQLLMKLCAIAQRDLKPDEDEAEDLRGILTQLQIALMPTQRRLEAAYR